jgi:peptidoglycan/LPS O-acetylase OafA/YrhL
LSLLLLAMAFLSAVLLGLLLHHGVEAPLSRLARHLLMPRRRAALFAGATETAS